MVNLQKFFYKNSYIIIIFVAIIILVFTQLFKKVETFQGQTASTATCNIDFCIGNPKYEMLFNSNGSIKGCYMKCNEIMSRGLRGVTATSNQMICNYTNPTTRAVHSVSRDFNSRRIDFTISNAAACAANSAQLYTLSNGEYRATPYTSDTTNTDIFLFCRNRNGRVVNGKCNYCPLTAPFMRPDPVTGSCIKRLSKRSEK